MEYSSFEISHVFELLYFTGQKTGAQNWDTFPFLYLHGIILCFHRRVLVDGDGNPVSVSESGDDDKNVVRCL